MKRTFLSCACGALLLCAAASKAWPAGRAETAPFPPSTWQGDPLVTTRYGLVQGYADSGETWAWRGIPYARPPVGDLRWRAPVDPKPWRGILKARGFGGQCTQYFPGFPWIIAGSEDCLYLNVWRPKTLETRLPVYFWIHGGGNSIGSAHMVPDYYGNALARASNMVFVSVNYRLGPFGWFTHPALREGKSREDDSGNYGTLDIVRALRWVRDNIGAFGGDPSNVLVAGESAGAMNTLSLLISPLATGLFSKALVESGAAITRTTAEADAKSDAVLRQLLWKDGRAWSMAKAASVEAGMGPEEIRAYLRGKTDREILRCYDGGGLGMIDNPAILRDGFVLPQEGYGALDAGNLPSKVPLVIGTNENELKLFLSFSMDYKSEIFNAISKYGTAQWKAGGVDGVARKLAAIPGQPPVYAYLFSWGAVRADGTGPLPGDWGRRLGAFHSLEIPFFLGTDTIEGFLFTSLLFTKENYPGRKALSGAMMDYISQFARTGDPNRPDSGLPVWQPWSNEVNGPKVIVFNVGGSELDIAMSGKEVTAESIEAEMRSGLSAELYQKTTEYLSRSMTGTPGK
jgi:para-nitrobenzyl esterase